MASDPVSATRRNYIKAAMAAGGLLAFSSLKISAAPEPRSHPRLPTLEDFLAMEAVGVARSSPDGRWLAVEIARGRALPAVHQDDQGETRSDIWLLDLQTGRSRRLTNGAATGAGVWSPIWSPNGATLAVLTNEGFHDARPAMLDVGSGLLRVCSGAAASLSANFGSMSRALPEGRHWGIWCNDTEFLTVLLAPGDSNFEDEVGDPAPVYDALWAKTRNDELSVTTWDSRKPVVCRAASRLVSIDARSATVQRTLVVGGVRSLSLSPDGHYAALVSAVRPKPVPPAENAIGYELGYNAYDMDFAVETQLSIYNLVEDKIVGVVPNVSGIGFAHARRHPQWAASGAFLAVPALTPDQQSRVHRVQIPSLAVETFEARSPLDAELLSALVARASPHAAPGRWAQRLDVSNEPVGPLSPPSIAGAVLSFDGEDVAIITSQSLVAIDLLGRPLQAIPLKGAVVNYWRPPSVPTGLAVFRSSSGAFAVERRGGALRKHALWIPSDSPFTVWSISPSGRPLWGVPNQRSRLWLSERLGVAPRPILTLNPDLDDLWRPEVRRFDYRQSDGSSAIGELWLPPNYLAERPSPLIIWGYPGWGPVRGASGSGAILNESNLHPLLLCAQGYIVGIPYMPLRPAAAQREPLDYVADQVERFAAALLGQGIASKGRLGFFGHSYGGYTALAVEARSRLINAVVAYSPFADLISNHDVPQRYIERDECAPSVMRYMQSEEEAPNAFLLRMGGSPEGLLAKYIANSPRFQFSGASPPLLMIQGEQDARGFRQVDAVYMVLSRLGVPVRAARYWAEGHMICSPANLRDAHKQMADWFEQHLGAHA